MGNIITAIYFLFVFVFSVFMAAASGIRFPKSKLGMAFAGLAYISLCCSVITLKEFMEYMQWHLFK